MSIRYLQEQKRNKIKYDKATCPSSINIFLWTYLLWHYNHIYNCLPEKDYRTSMTERSSGSTVVPKLRDNNDFGWMVYSFHNRLQTGGEIIKWNLRARMGVYLGPSPINTSYTYLVLNI